MMKELISAFPNHLEEAFTIGTNAELAPARNDIKNVIITGLGGSGIGGTIVSQLVADEAKIPITVNKTYSLPAFVNENTLVIVSSYSGNTEETLAAMEIACKKGAEICCISTNGEVLEIAKEHNLNHIVVTDGMPPRAAFAYSFTQLFFILNHYGIISDSFQNELRKGRELLQQEETNIKQDAKCICTQLAGKLPVIYSSAPWEGVCVRFRQQLNENAKMLAWHHVFPELNHNELVGWRNENNNLAVVIFRNENDFKRTQKRIEISKPIFEKYTKTIIEIFSKGDSNIERTLYLINLGDWVSWYLSEANNMDAIEIDVIEHLKSELAKF